MWAVRASVSQKMAGASIETVLREVPGMQRMLQGGFINLITDNSDSTFPRQGSSDINTWKCQALFESFLLERGFSRREAPRASSEWRV